MNTNHQNIVEITSRRPIDRLGGAMLIFVGSTIVWICANIDSKMLQQIGTLLITFFVLVIFGIVPLVCGLNTILNRRVRFDLGNRQVMVLLGLTNSMAIKLRTFDLDDFREVEIKQFRIGFAAKRQTFKITMRGNQKRLVLYSWIARREVALREGRRLSSLLMLPLVEPL
jgi:hypothetical protein